MLSNRQELYNPKELKIRFLLFQCILRQFSIDAPGFVSEDILAHLSLPGATLCL